MPTDIGCEFFHDPTTYPTYQLAASGAATFGGAPTGSTCTLASITSDVEQMAAEAKLPDPVDAAVWIGGFIPVPQPQCGGTSPLGQTGTDAELCAAAGWQWLDGSPWTYQNWEATDEPDNINDNQFFLAIYLGDTAGNRGDWFDVSYNQVAQVSAGALFKCCESTTGDVPDPDGLAKLPLPPP